MKTNLRTRARLRKMFRITVLMTLISLMALTAVSLQAQVTIGDKTGPQPFSLLEITTSIQKGGLRLPQLSTEDRRNLNIASNAQEAKGLVIYNTDKNCIEYWNNIKWVSLCTGSSSIFITNIDGNDPFDPSDPITDPDEEGGSVFSKDGEEKGPFTPGDSPACTQNPPYKIIVVSGGEYSMVEVTDPSTGEFTLTMQANPTVSTRYAIVRIINNCTLEYRDFLFSQEAQDVGVYPDPANPNVPATGENRGPFTPDENPETCPNPGTWNVTSSQPWCIASFNPNTGVFSLQFLPNPSIYPRDVVITVKNNGCSDKQAEYEITQNGNSIGIGTDNTNPNIPAMGGETGPSTPEGNPTCTNSPAYTLSLISGSPYARLLILDVQTGRFKVKFEANSSIYERYAVVRVKDNCSGAFRDFTYAQDGQNVGVYPDTTNPDVPATGGQQGPYTPETNPANCPNPAPYTVTSDREWCTPVVTNATTGTFYLRFEPNHLSTARTANITITATGCSKSTSYQVKQQGANVDLGIENYPAPEVPAAGGNTPVGAPESEVRCTQNPAYVPVLISGNAYTALTVIYAPLGLFCITFSPNPSTSSRTATVRVTNPCNGLYTDFIYTQLGLDCSTKAVTATGNLSQTVEKGNPVTEVTFGSSSAISVTGTAPGISVSGKGSNLVTITGSPTIAGSYTFEASTGNAGCAGEKKSFLLEVTGSACPLVTDKPVAESATGLSLCDSGTNTATFSVVAQAGETYRWYDSSDDFKGEGSSFTTPALAVGTHTYFAGTKNSTGCETDKAHRLSFTVTVYQRPSSDTNIATINSSTGVLEGKSAGSVSITYTVTGAGGCQKASDPYAVTVNANPATIPAGAGMLGGKNCFDIALSNDNLNGCGTLASRTGMKADFTQTAVNTQTYTFTTTILSAT